MKKCPYCAEEVQDLAMRCKHCHMDLANKPTPVSASTVTTNKADASHWVMRVILWSCVFVAYMIFLAASPFIAAVILLVVIWAVKGQSKQSLKERLTTWKTHKVRVGLSVAALMFSLVIQVSLSQEAKEKAFIASYPVPTIAVTSDTSNQGANTEYFLTFTVSDATKVTVEDEEYQPDAMGVYTVSAPLGSTSTRFDIVATNDYKKAEQTVTITRDRTVEEQAAYEKAQAEAEQAARKAEAKEAAEKRAWETSEAGRICTRHPDWSKEDCTMIADNKYWVGMSYDMLKELRGTPNSANPSNYGYGVQWQWCWYNYTPMCFYDDDNDGLVDSYN